MKSSTDEQALLRIRDISGRLITEHTVNQQLQTIYFPAVTTSGVYLVERLSKGSLETQKLILQR